MSALPHVFTLGGNSDICAKADMSCEWNKLGLDPKLEIGSSMMICYVINITY